MFWPYSVLHKKSPTLDKSRGFGLIELMVSISIMVIVAGIVLARQDAFNGAVLLRSQAYEIAFAIRQVQLTAVSATDPGGAAAFRQPLGVHFSTAAGLNKQYITFSDSNGDDSYQASEQLGQIRQIDERFYISQIEVGGSDETAASAVFERPNFDARFSSAFPSTGGEMLIYLRARDADAGDTGPQSQRVIEITSTGQISVR
jgi:prepilin-type N-terminal cleavage/methylation domain-containing protein